MDIAGQSGARHPTISLRRRARGVATEERMIILVAVLTLYSLIGSGSACCLQ
ncbi:hypothetical protein [Sphingomonas sp.]|uniref:hypothetical protein n=1 Tax=Sphingomonas sp. TaxID=28214 RepID=UPI0025F978BF|nr:hypothetical protein [Sphingomonas sp.]